MSQDEKGLIPSDDLVDTVSGWQTRYCLDLKTHTADELLTFADLKALIKQDGLKFQNIHAEKLWKVLFDEPA